MAIHKIVDCHDNLPLAVCEIKYLPQSLSSTLSFLANQSFLT